MYSRVGCLAAKEKKKCALHCVFFVSFGICMFILCAHFFTARRYLKYNKSDVPVCSLNLFLLEYRSEFINHSALIGVFLKCTGFFLKKKTFLHESC